MSTHTESMKEPPEWTPWAQIPLRDGHPDGTSVALWAPCEATFRRGSYRRIWGRAMARPYGDDDWQPEDAT